MFKHNSFQENKGDDDWHIWGCNHLPHHGIYYNYSIQTVHVAKIHHRHKKPICIYLYIYVHNKWPPLHYHLLIFSISVVIWVCSMGHLKSRSTSSTRINNMYLLLQQTNFTWQRKTKTANQLLRLIDKRKKVI